MLLALQLPVCCSGQCPDAIPKTRASAPTRVLQVLAPAQFPRLRALRASARELLQPGARTARERKDGGLAAARHATVVLGGP